MDEDRSIRRRPRTRALLAVTVGLVAGTAGVVWATRPAARGATVLCGKPYDDPYLQAVVHRPASDRIELDTARLFSATIDVTAVDDGPACRVLRSGDDVALGIGQSVELVANHAPAVNGLPPSPLTGEVRVTTRSGPDGHVDVTLTALRAGNVDVVWTDCSGTGC